MSIGKYIRQRREDLEITQQMLADRVGVSKSAVSRWETGDIANMGISNLKAVSKVLNINPLDIINDNIVDEAHKPTPNNINTKAVPLIGSIAAGAPILADQNIEGYFNIDKKISADFCLRVKGHSMINVNILDGDIVFIRKQSDIDNGQIGAVLIDNEATLKRFYKTNGTVILQAENPNFKPIVLHGGDVKVLGLMVASLRQY